MKILIASLWLIVGAFVAAQTYAHGDAPDAKKAATVPTNAEQREFGIAGDPAKASRTIKLEVHDSMRFSPSEIQVKQGETIRFVVKNPAKLMHEMVIGTMKDLKSHAELMKKFPNMEHDEPHMAHVPPGKAVEIVWTFNRAGTFYFACLVAGHFEAGMIGKLVVK